MNGIEICEDCTTDAMNVKKRKRMEREVIARLDGKSIEVGVWVIF